MATIKKQTLVAYATVAAEAASATQNQLRALSVGGTAYDEVVVDSLEQYLTEQLAAETVDIDANLALLKLYLIYPERSDAGKIANVLIKATMALPSKGFVGAAAMVPESVREDDNIKQILDAGFTLQSCRFEDFWKLDLAFAKDVAGFEAAVRAFILEALSKSHSLIASAVLQKHLNIAENDVQALVAAEGWTAENDLITITPNEDNQMRAKKVQEDVAFDDMLKVIHTLCR